jgi:hypothetical protein
MSTRGMIATMTIEEPTDSDIFLAYVEQVLCPALRPGDVVAMDNLLKLHILARRLLIRRPACSLRMREASEGFAGVLHNSSICSARERSVRKHPSVSRP